MAIYTGTADANGDFSIPFGTSYTGGQKVTVTAEKDAAIKTIELFAPSEVTGGGAIQFTGNYTSFPNNIGGVVLTSEIGASIGAYAFAAYANAGNIWKKATSLTIPNSVTSIGAYAFYDWSAAKSLTLPSNITTIASYCFQGWVEATSLTIPNTVTSIQTYAFQGWVKSTSLTLSDSLLSVGAAAFQSWSALTSLVIPNSVTTISDSAFQNATSLLSLTLGSGLTTIGAASFVNLTSCNTMTCLATTPPTIQANTFTFLNASCQIRVPSASLLAYQSAANWSALASKMVGI